VNPIDFLEHGGGPLVVRHQGLSSALPDPRQRHFQWVLAVLETGYVPGTPEGVPLWKTALVFDRWCAAWELPEASQAKRLAYLVDHYRAAISHDLAIHTRYDLGDLWRARRWTLLLDILDRLPAHSQYASTVSMDKEHAAMLAEQLAEQDEDPEAEKSGPSLAGWSQEVAAMTNVFDAVRQVQHTLIAVNSEKGKVPEPPKPAPRPSTPLEAAMKTAAFRRRQARHEALVALVLPKKGDVKP